MKIRQYDNNNKGRFYIQAEGVTKAEMTYSYAGNDKIIIDHTEVDESLKGQGVGYKLLESVVEFARTQNLKILPLCPFTASAFKKKTEYKDVLF
ncbi:GNAT family N-acetyltransferase [Psychroserpens sp. XS_ASV72]|uniref:GNAT family N-acetyltransferase n=1 Tax=Psychroserpens sp. XS_ASV72 TaxID=3241293 RepID=UPI003510D970